MRHASCARRLSQYVDDTLGASTRAAMDGHLGRCAPCREELASLRRTVHLLGTLTVADEPVPGFADQLLARIADGEADPSWLGRVADGWRGFMDSSWGAPLATAAVGLSLLAVVQGVEIQLTIPGFGSPAAEAAPVLDPALDPHPGLAPVAVSRGPLASRRRTEPLPVMPPRTACMGNPAAPECARWNAWLVGLGLREPADFLRELEAVPARSRARWLGELSRFAAHSGSAPVLAARLRASGDPRASGVAAHFERTAASPDR